MVTLSAEQQAKMLASSRESAAALIEDLVHLREIVNRVDPIRGELRRVSAVMRRLLVERDLAIVAHPRVGRFNFCAPDNNPILAANDKQPYLFFLSGGAQISGFRFRVISVGGESSHRPFDDFNPDRTVEMRLDGFLAQPVLCLQGTWVSRRDAIKYVANFNSGVHSKSPQTDEEKIMKKIQLCLEISASNNGVSVTYNPNQIPNPLGADQPLGYSPESIDPLLIELLAAIHFLLISPDLRKLEAIIKSELGLP